MMALKRVEEPEVSPDGRWVLFAAVDVDLKANTKTPHMWVAPLDQTPGGPSTEPGDSRANHSALQAMAGEGNGATSNGGEREIISDQDADRPRWAPDGKRFAFISTKENGSQIWIADFDGAAGAVTGKHRLTALATEADGELWSPDGKNILFKSDVDPECDGTPAEETRCNQNKLEERKNSKVKALVFTHLLYRHWNAYKEGTRTHLLVIDVPESLCDQPGQKEALTGGNACPVIGFPRDLTPGDYDAPVFSLGGQDDYAFSPDGREICYASNHDPEPAISTNNDLFTVPANFPADATSKDVLAATRDITRGNKAADNTPLYSPDGNYIAYRAQRRPGYESDRWGLMLYDRRTGERKDLTEGFDHWVGSFVWGRDPERVYFSAEHERHSLIYAVDATPRSNGSYFRRSLVSGSNDDLAITPDGKTLVFTRMSISAPNEIHASPAGEGCPAQTGDVDRGKWKCTLNADWALTRVNQPLLSEINMSEVEPFWFEGARGDKVEGSMVKPPNFDASRKYPVKFLIHGGPEGAWGDDWSYRWNPELFAANGYVVIMINFHGSTGYGQKFIDAINGDWGGAPFEDLMKGLDYAEEHYPFIDKGRECALGASYGGYMANWILGHTGRFKCIVSHDGMFNAESAWGATEELWFNEWEFKGRPDTNRELYRKWSPHLSAANFKTPTLVVHGQLDYRLDVSQGFDLFTTLQRLGVPSKMLYFPDEGHWVLKPQNSELWYKTVNDWVDQWTGSRAGKAN
ncbi:MAG: S9 family peptidase [Acidobacteria bacterium]|nr:S9 family peptidase [Acidobacteriota bacterium]